MKKSKSSINLLVRKNIQQLTPYSSARSEFKGAAEVFLDANENPFDTGYNRYPDPLQHQLKKKIALQKKVAPQNIFLGNGSDEAIDLLIRIFCEPAKDHIITLPPTYGMYQVSAAISNIKIKTVPLNKKFQPRVQSILKHSNAHSKILFLCSPNNPTGNSFHLNKIQSLIKKFPGIVVVDEAYIDFSTQKSCIQFLERYPNLVVLQTFSKAWGLAGIRLGMAFASTEIIDLFNKVKPPYNINQLTQETAIKALNKAKKQQKWLRLILEERQTLQKNLEKLAFVKKIYPTDANFILVQMENPNKVYTDLVNQKIIVRNRSNVLLCEGCLRITVGTKKENRRLIKALKKMG